MAKSNIQTATWALGQEGIFIQYTIKAYEHMIHCCLEQKYI